MNEETSEGRRQEAGRSRLWLRLGAGALGLIAALIGVLLVRAATFESRQRAVPPVAVIPVDAAGAAERLGAAIRIKTVSDKDRSKMDPAAFEALHRHLEVSFPKAHAAMAREVIGGSSLMFTWEGSDPSLAPAMLLAHMDVVPVEAQTADQWVKPPFEGRVEGGYVWGRGAMDDKCGVMGIMEAVELLAAEGFAPRRTIMLGFGHDEEVGGQEGALRMAALLAERGVTLEFLLDEGLMITEGIVPGIEAPVALVGIAEKGYLSVELIAEVEGGHASTPPRQTAVGVLAQAITTLEARPMPARLDGAARQMFMTLGPEMPFGQKLAFANLWLLEPVILRQLTANPATNALVRTTTAPTMLQGSDRDNVLPSRASAVVNFRLLPGDTVESVLAHVTDAVDQPAVRVAAMAGFQDEPSAVSDPGSLGYAVIEGATRQIYPEALVAPALFIAAADARHFAKVSRATFRFMPQRLTPEDRPRFHGINERIGVEDYARLVRFYRQVMINASGESAGVAKDEVR